MPRVPQQQGQHWSLAARTNDTTATANPELLVVVLLTETIVAVSQKGAGCWTGDFQLGLFLEVACCHACLECPSLVPSPDQPVLVLILKIQPRRPSSRKPDFLHNSVLQGIPYSAPLLFTTSCLPACFHVSPTRQYVP